MCLLGGTAIIVREGRFCNLFLRKCRLCAIIAQHAPVAQRIEYRSSEPWMWVRFLPGAQILKIPQYRGIFSICKTRTGFEPKVPIFNEQSDYKNGAFRPTGEAIPAGRTQFKEGEYVPSFCLLVQARAMST